MGGAIEPAPVLGVRGASSSPKITQLRELLTEALQSLGVLDVVAVADGKIFSENERHLSSWPEPGTPFAAAITQAVA